MGIELEEENLKNRRLCSHRESAIANSLMTLALWKYERSLVFQHLDINSWWSQAMFLFWHIKQNEDICLNLRHPFSALCTRAS